MDSPKTLAIKIIRFIRTPTNRSSPFLCFLRFYFWRLFFNNAEGRAVVPTQGTLVSMFYFATTSRCLVTPCATPSNTRVARSVCKVVDGKKARRHTCCGLVTNLHQAINDGIIYRNLIHLPLNLIEFNQSKGPIAYYSGDGILENEVVTQWCNFIAEIATRPRIL